MNRKLSKVLRECFARELASAAPEFKERQYKDFPPGWRVYHYSRASKHHWFIVLAPRSNADSFVIEIRWGESDVPAGVLPEYPTEARTNANGNVRLHELWVPPSQASRFAWKLPQERTIEELKMQMTVNEESIERLEARVLPRVKDAVQKIVEYGLPYLESTGGKAQSE